MGALTLCLARGGGGLTHFSPLPSLRDGDWYIFAESNDDSITSFVPVDGQIIMKT